MSRFLVVALCAILLQPALAARHVRRKPLAQRGVVKAVPLPPEKIRRQVVYLQNRDVCCIDPKTRRKHLLFKNLLDVEPITEFYNTTFDPNRFIAWSPDRSRIAYVRHNAQKISSIWVMDWDGTHKHVVVPEDANRGCWHLQWNPSGTPLLLFETHSTRTDVGFGFVGFGIVDTASPKELQGPYTLGNASFWNPVWSADGQEVLLDYSPNSADYASEGPPRTKRLFDLATNTLSVPTDTQLSAFPAFNAFNRIEDPFIEQLSAQGFTIRRLVTNAQTGETVFGAMHKSLILNSNDQLEGKFDLDVWLSSTSLKGLGEAYPIQRLVKGAQLIDWL